MSKILTVNLRIREDIDPDLYRVISEIPKGKGRSEYIRRLLSQVKIPRKRNDDAHNHRKPAEQTQPVKTVEKFTPAAVVAPAPKPVATIKPESAHQSSNFENDFVSGLGGVPKR